jgi:hypothetical protein
LAAGKWQRRQNISDLQFILSDMTQNMKLEDSVTLAHRLQQSVVGGMGKRSARCAISRQNGALCPGLPCMPACWSKCFVTHRVEGAAMSRDAGQDAMVNSLFEGFRNTVNRS